MQVSILPAMVLGVLCLSGCAGPRHAQEINRLKADIGLLDQRVSQLERASLREPTSGLPADMQIQPLPAETTPAPTRQPATPPSIKPSKKEIQQALKAVGFYQGPIDGKIGPQTQQAIREFQRVNGLVVDGIVGAKTWEKLSPYLSLETGSSELSAAETRK